jgi:hypothetical protein
LRRKAATVLVIALIVLSAASVLVSGSANALAYKVDPKTGARIPYAPVRVPGRVYIDGGSASRIR